MKTLLIDTRQQDKKHIKKDKYFEKIPKDERDNVGYIIIDNKIIEEYKVDISTPSVLINNFNFIGNKKTASQLLEFPRNFLPELPFEIQYAVCEEALALIENSVHSKNKKFGISSVTIGKSTVSYFQKNNSFALLSDEAYNFVSKWTAKNFDISWLWGFHA